MEANKQLDEFEQVLRTVDDLGNTMRILADSPLEVPEQKVLIDLLFNKERRLADAYRTETETDPTWMDVLADLESFAEGFEQPSLHKSVQEQFDIKALPPVELDVTNILDEETPSAAIDRIHEVEETLAEQSRFTDLADTGLSIVTTAQGSSIEGSNALVETLTIQLEQAYEQVVGSGKADCLGSLEESLDTSRQAINLAESYRDFPFEEPIADLAAIDGIRMADKDQLATLSKILSVSNDALSVLETTDYDHPAIDQANWQESIREALKNRYLKILHPIDEQLSRIECGLWEPQDLSAYDWREFEHLIGDLYRDNGHEVTVSQSGPDMGVDVWAKNNDTRMAIQVKHFQEGDTVGREPLQKLVSTLAKGDADQAVVVTSSNFAETAKRYAADFGTGLSLIDRDELLRQLSESTIPPRGN